MAKAVCEAGDEGLQMRMLQRVPDLVVGVVGERIQVDTEGSREQDWVLRDNLKSNQKPRLQKIQRISNFINFTQFWMGTGFGGDQ